MDRLRGAAILAVLVLTRSSVPAALSGVLLTPALGKPWRAYLSGKLRHLLWPYLVWVHLGRRVRRTARRRARLGLRRPARLRPRTYLWFLAHLFVFYLLGLALPGWLRVLGGRLLVLGLDGPVPLFVLAVVGSSAVGAVLVQGRRHPGVDALFAWPAPVRASRREVRTPALR